MNLKNEIVVVDDFLTKEEVREVRDIVFYYANSIKEWFPNQYAAAPENALTGRYAYFNLLGIKEFADVLEGKILNVIKSACPTWTNAWVQCWANDFHYGQSIGWHTHNSLDSEVSVDDYLVANLFCGGADTETLYINPNDNSIIHVPNKDGCLTLLNSMIWHCSTPNLGEDTRLSIALDIYNGDTKSETSREFLRSHPWRFKQVIL